MWSAGEMAIDKRKLRSEAKQLKPKQGVFALRCTPSGQVWVSHSRNLDASKNSVFFMLRGELHKDKALQAAYNEHGEAAFVFDVLEQFDEDLPAVNLWDQMVARQKHWSEQLQAPVMGS